MMPKPSPRVQEIWFEGPLPGLNISLGLANQRYGKTNAYAIKKRTLQKALVAQIEECSLVKMEKVTIDFIWHEPNRRRDPDNIISAKKYILDALVHARILSGDGWRWIKGLSDEWKIDEMKNGVNVIIRRSYDE